MHVLHRRGLVAESDDVVEVALRYVRSRLTSTVRFAGCSRSELVVRTSECDRRAGQRGRYQRPGNDELLHVFPISNILDTPIDVQDLRTTDSGMWEQGDI